jgi:diadenylate cyclase
MDKHEGRFSNAIVAAAAEVTKSVAAQVLFAYVHAIDDLEGLKSSVRSPCKLILICRDGEDEKRAKSAGATFMRVPDFDLTRMGQIKMATLLAFSQGMLKAGDVFVFLSGASRRNVDTLVVMRVGEEYELFQSVGQPKLTEHIRRPVFEKVLRLALELAYEGREGKPVGALFVIGDHKEVEKYSAPGRINPFKGYTERERNILDESLDESVKEIAKLDGAYIIKGNGVIVAACVNLRPAMAGERLAQGLGARHAAASSITASTRSVAITLSESTGDVRVWRRGSMITEIEKSPRTPLEGGPSVEARG